MTPNNMMSQQLIYHCHGDYCMTTNKKQSFMVHVLPFAPPWVCFELKAQNGSKSVAQTTYLGTA